MKIILYGLEIGAEIEKTGPRPVPDPLIREYGQVILHWWIVADDLILDFVEPPLQRALVLYAPR